MDAVDAVNYCAIGVVIGHEFSHSFDDQGYSVRCQGTARRLVLGEAIGDLAGMNIAYRAFQIAQKGKPPAATIDDFSPDQQFFIAWGSSAATRSDRSGSVP